MKSTQTQKRACPRCGCTKYTLEGFPIDPSKPFAHVRSRCAHCGGWMGGYLIKNRKKGAKA